MVRNSVQECRFKQSSYYFWNLALESLTQNELEQFSLYNMIADVYYTYHTVFQFTETPYSLINGSTLVNKVFHASRFLANMINIKTVQELQALNKINIYYSLAKVSA